jgi:hypothetical protein
MSAEFVRRFVHVCLVKVLDGDLQMVQTTLRIVPGPARGSGPVGTLAPRTHDAVAFPAFEQRSEPVDATFDGPGFAFLAFGSQFMKFGLGGFEVALDLFAPRRIEAFDVLGLDTRSSARWPVATRLLRFACRSGTDGDFLGGSFLVLRASWIGRLLSRSTDQRSDEHEGKEVEASKARQAEVHD